MTKANSAKNSSKQPKKSSSTQNLKITEAKNRLIRIESAVTNELWKLVRGGNEEVISTLEKWFPAKFASLECLMCGEMYDETGNYFGDCSTEHDVDDWDDGSFCGMAGWDKLYEYSGNCTICGEKCTKRGYVHDVEYDDLGQCWYGRHISDPNEKKRAIRKLRKANGYSEEEDDDDDDEDSQTGKIPEDIDPDAFAGRYVRKKFGRKVYVGVVTLYDDVGKFFKVKYEDGDREDYSYEELQAILTEKPVKKVTQAVLKKFYNDE